MQTRDYDVGRLRQKDYNIVALNPLYTAAYPNVFKIR